MSKRPTNTFKENTRPGIPEDFKTDFQTPVNVANYMVSLLPDSAKTVLEPTPGIGNIKRALINGGGRIVTAPEDYFLLDRKQRFDAIVMNPPFSRKFTIIDNAPDSVKEAGMRMGYWFLTDCMKRSDYVVALMPWFTISDSDVRLRMLYRYGMRSLTALPRKTFEWARIQTVVIVLEKGFKGDTIFKAFDCLTDDQQPKLMLEE